MIEPPAHLSPGAAAYLRAPDRLDYPTDWTDAWAVQEFREISTPLWCGLNEAIDFDYDVRTDAVGGVVVERVSVGTPASARVIVHVHGGMFCLGTPEIDRCLTAPLARATGLEVVSVDYRLAPEHRCPAAIDDVVAVCRAVAADHDVVALVGESAGGALALAAASQIAVGRLVLVSPMLDLTGSSDTYRTLTGADPDYGPDTEALLAPGRAYAGDLPLDHPHVSPLYADHAGLPPTLVQVGTREVLLGDSTRFARAARAAGVDVTLDVLDGGWHNYPIWYGVPEADTALADMAAFVVDAP